MPEVIIVLTIFDKFLNIVGLVREGKLKRDKKLGIETKKEEIPI